MKKKKNWNKVPVFLNLQNNVGIKIHFCYIFSENQEDSKIKTVYEENLLGTAGTLRKNSDFFKNSVKMLPIIEHKSALACLTSKSSFSLFFMVLATKSIKVNYIICFVVTFYKRRYCYLFYIF